MDKCWEVISFQQSAAENHSINVQLVDLHCVCLTDEAVTLLLGDGVLVDGTHTDMHARARICAHTYTQECRDRQLMGESACHCVFFFVFFSRGRPPQTVPARSYTLTHTPTAPFFPLPNPTTTPADWTRWKTTSLTPLKLTWFWRKTKEQKKRKVKSDATNTCWIFILSSKIANN